jgi:hypothetical protein
VALKNSDFDAASWALSSSAVRLSYAQKDERAAEKSVVQNVTTIKTVVTTINVRRLSRMA